MSSLWKLFIFPCLQVVAHFSAAPLIYITNEFYRLAGKFKLSLPQLDFQYLEKQTLDLLLWGGKKCRTGSLFKNIGCTVGTRAGKYFFIIKWLFRANIRNLSILNREKGAVWLEEHCKSGLFTPSFCTVKTGMFFRHSSSELKKSLLNFFHT